MRLDFAFLCTEASFARGYPDVAEVGIDIARSGGVPASSPKILLIARLTADVGEIESRSVAVRWLDPDGNAFGELQQTLELDRSSPWHPPKLSVAMGWESVTIPAFGTYTVQLLVDGEEQARIPFVVIQAT